MSEINRIIIIVFDSVGVGELPDADEYGDVGSNTLVHTADAGGGLALPNLQKLGLGNIIPVQGVPPAESPLACFGKMTEQSVGKDTTMGHWEISGVITSRPFPTYPHGFPDEVIDAFQTAIGREVIGNCVASGTEIIKALGEEHVRTGKPIVYTSADSVFQMACHESVVPIDQLYEWCRIARDILVEPHNVARVIARPFVGCPGDFHRTERRKDFSVPPPSPTLLDAVAESGGSVVAIGKISDIFAGRGITRSIHTGNNTEGMNATVEAVRSGEGTLVFTNLVDFDMLYGHRNDPEGYARALETVDSQIPELIDALLPSDLLVITADHGCDPITASTDHSREYVPLLVYGPSIKHGVDIGVRTCFCDISATVTALLGVTFSSDGYSFAESLLKIS